MSGRIMDIKEQLSKSLQDPSKPWTALLSTAEKKTGVDRLYVFIGSIVLIGLWLAFGYAAQLVCNLVGFLYPSYTSIKAIESPGKDDDTKWLTYWTVFGVFSVVEYFADFIVGWFPLYWLVKCLFLIWLMIPTDFNGSLIVYGKLIKPYFLKHQSQIDETVNRVRESVRNLTDKSD